MLRPMLDSAPYDRALCWTRHYAQPRSVLWERWTTVEGLRQFFGADHRVELRVGGRFEILFLLDQPVGRQGAEGCVLLRFEPEDRLAFTWNAPPHIPACRAQHMTVELRFAEAPGGGCALQLEQRGFGRGADWDATYTYFAAAWPRVLAALEASFYP